MSNQTLRKSLEWLLKGTALVATWVLIFIAVHFIAHFIADPWDSSIVQPAVGTWQRAVNDFFDVGPGELMVAIAVVLGNMFLALRMVWRRRVLPWGFILLNALFVGLFPSLMVLTFGLNNMFFSPVEDGYHLAIIPGIVAMLLLTLWFMGQSQLHDRRKRKRQASDTLMDESPAALDRLALEDGSAAWDADWDHETHAQQSS